MPIHDMGRSGQALGGSQDAHGTDLNGWLVRQGWANSNRQEQWMSELSLEMSEKFSDEADGIQAELSNHLDVSEPNVWFHMGDPPSYVQLLGDAMAWLPLSAPATVYLTTLAKRAAEATWDKIVNRNEVKPLADVATTLATAAARVDGEVIIAVGLDIPDDTSGTSISIKSSDPEEVARVLAYFIVHVEQLSKAMQAEVAAGREPHREAIIELQDDESLLVRWQTANGRAQEIKIPRTRS